MNAVDRQTTEAVELRVPGLSSRDSSVLSRSYLAGKNGKGGWGIFVRCPSEFKGKLRANILKAQDRIPTLGTFFEDLKYLASSTKLPIDPPTKQTSIHKLFPKILYRNRSEFGPGYRALWLFCMQNFPQLVSSSSRKEPKRPKPVVFKPNRRTFGEFAQLANSFGFRSPAITAHVANLDKATAKEFFLKARPPEMYAYDLDAEVAKLESSLARFSKRKHDFVKPKVLSQDALDITRRPGRPIEADHDRDASFLEEEPMCSGPTTDPGHRRMAWYPWMAWQ